jgi:hypothetical protein
MCLISLEATPTRGVEFTTDESVEIIEKGLPSAHQS